MASKGGGVSGPGPSHDIPHEENRTGVTAHDPGITRLDHLPDRLTTIVVNLEHSGPFLRCAHDHGGTLCPWRFDGCASSHSDKTPEAGKGLRGGGDGRREEDFRLQIFRFQIELPDPASPRLNSWPLTADS